MKRNRFFYSVNLLGFLTGFLMLIVILSFVYQELSFDKFHEKTENIFRVNAGGYGVTPLCFREKLMNKIPEISEIVRFKAESITIIENGQQLDTKKLYYTDNNIFNIFSFGLTTGNPETVLMKPNSVVLNKSTARQLFGNSPPVGEMIKSNTGLNLTVTGVMEDIPANSHLQCDMFVSIETLRSKDNDPFDCRNWSNLTYILLNDKTAVKDVEDKINELLEDSRMTTSEGKIQLKLQALSKLYFDYDNNKFDGCKHGNIQTVIIYSAISILLILLVVINYINLFVAISSGKIKSIAIKKILGATRNKIIKQFVLEALGVSIISFVIAITLTELFLPDISGLLSLNIAESLNLEPVYFIFFSLTVFIGITTGVISGFSLSRLNVTKALKNESFFNARGIQRKLLLTFQLTIVAILLNSTFIINKQIRFLLIKDLGFNYQNVVYVELNDKLADKQNILKSKLLENPAIKNISFSTSLLGDDFGKAPMGNENNIHLCSFYSIDPDYAGLFKLQIKDGRNFSWNLKTDFEDACLINEKTCKIFGLENPVNKMLGDKRIIGVIRDFNFNSLHSSIGPLVVKCSNNGNIMQAKIAENNINKTVKYMKEICNELSPDNKCNISFLDNHLKSLYASEFELKRSFGVYSLLTLVIALLGIFGLALFILKKKYKEISIRKLFGAKLKHTFLIIAKEYLTIVCISNLVAIPLSYFFMNKWLANFQYKVGFGYFAFIKSFLVILVFTLLAILHMIFKSHSINPANALKDE